MKTTKLHVTQLDLAEIEGALSDAEAALESIRGLVRELHSGMSPRTRMAFRRVAEIERERQDGRRAQSVRRKAET